MKAIHKFRLRINDDSRVLMAKHYEALSVSLIGGELYLWAIVETNDPLEMVCFKIRGTGHPLREVGQYVGTARDATAGLVWHVFESPAACAALKELENAE